MTERNNRSMPRVLFFTLIVMLLFLLAACGRDSNPGQYREDGYLGLTQTNPHLPTNPTQRSYYADRQAMKRALIGIEGVEHARIMANGPHVQVILWLADGYTDQQREAIRIKALQALEYNNPRSDYAVRLAD